MGRVLGHQCLLVGLTENKSQLSSVVLTGGRFTIWSKAPTGVRHSHSHRDWEVGPELQPGGGQHLTVHWSRWVSFSNFISSKE